MLNYAKFRNDKTNRYIYKYLIKFNSLTKLMWRRLLKAKAQSVNSYNWEYKTTERKVFKEKVKNSLNTCSCQGLFLSERHMLSCSNSPKIHSGENRHIRGGLAAAFCSRLAKISRCSNARVPGGQSGSDPWHGYWRGWLLQEPPLIVIIVFGHLFLSFSLLQMLL